jgi:hypothetical protein
VILLEVKLGLAPANLRVLRRGPLKIRLHLERCTVRLRTPSMVVRIEDESPAMQQLRDSVSRARELAQRMLDSVYRFGPREASGRITCSGHAAPRVSEQGMRLAKHFNREDSTPAGHLFAPEILCRDGTGALYNKPCETC